MKSRLFFWDWKENPPLTKIVKAAQQIPNAKCWNLDSGGDTFIMYVAATKTEAEACYLTLNEKWLIDEWNGWSGTEHRWRKNKGRTPDSKANKASFRKFTKKFLKNVTLWQDD